MLSPASWVSICRARSGNSSWLRIRLEPAAPRPRPASSAGQVDYMCDQIVNVVQQVEAGQIKAYAIGTPTRNAALPKVPTSKEAGLPQFEAQAWNALFAPKGTPKPIVDKLSAALDKA